MLGLDENDLIKKSIKGDFQSFEELIKPYQKKIYNLCYRLIGNPHDALDLSQEVILKVYKALGKFRMHSSFSTWLYRITVNTCADELRKRKKYAKFVSLEQMQDNGMRLPDSSSNSSCPQAELSRNESIKHIISAINRLPFQFKTVIVLKDLYGFTYNEIANIQRCSIGTVKSRLNRARNYLKDMLQKDEEHKGY